MESEKVSDKLEKNKYSNTLINDLSKLFLIISNDITIRHGSRNPGKGCLQRQNPKHFLVKHGPRPSKSLCLRNSLFQKSVTIYPRSTSDILCPDVSWERYKKHESGVWSKIGMSDELFVHFPSPPTSITMYLK